MVRMHDTLLILYCINLQFTKCFGQFSFSKIALLSEMLGANDQWYLSFIMSYNGVKYSYFSTSIIKHFGLLGYRCH